MVGNSEGAGDRPCWFVGAAYGGTEDQAERFLRDGIWEHGYEDRYLDAVKSVQVGDRIALKSSYTRKNGLPFDNHGYAVSVMAIKATGTVTKNFGDGRRLAVDWQPEEHPREWYFYTYRNTIWKVAPGEWMTDALIAFAFDGDPQNIQRFCNAPSWRERFGDRAPDESRFAWTRFYEAVADAILPYRNRRDELVEAVQVIASSSDGLSPLQDKFAGGSTAPLQDICPFTTMGIFNRWTTDPNRKMIAKKLADFLGVTEAVPDSIDGVPLLSNQGWWFFGAHHEREEDDIDALWEVFAQGMEFADSDDPDEAASFIAAYDSAAGRIRVGWKLSMGLFWARPWSLPTLDSQSREYIEQKLSIKIGGQGHRGRCSGKEYLALLRKLRTRFQEDTYPVHSFPELSLTAWQQADTPGEAVDDDNNAVEDGAAVLTSEMARRPVEQYTLDNILNDGCFFPRELLATILERLRSKKNVILQGPPGVGKSWLARRLAFALLGERDEARVRAVQFHPNLSYEDFVRGWRPSGDGRLELVDGPFLEMVEAATEEPEEQHVIVIEEINRGNPAQIFGELLTLIEADKRTPSEALELSYRKYPGERVSVPANMSVIGTMNIADRSLALVDLALRRRFAFVTLEPALGDRWRAWLASRWQIEPEVLADIEARILSLNDEITDDSSLGPQFCIGHSYVTPAEGGVIKDAREWFRQVVRTEIGPLLEEYWFDVPGRARKRMDSMLEGF